MSKNIPKKQPDKARNLVAKHAKTFNKAVIYIDKKSALKRGKIKHKAKESYLMQFLLKCIK